jgi:hypothetical protein
VALLRDRRAPSSTGRSRHAPSRSPVPGPPRARHVAPQDAHQADVDAPRPRRRRLAAPLGLLRGRQPSWRPPPSSPVAPLWRSCHGQPYPPGAIDHPRRPRAAAGSAARPTTTRLLRRQPSAPPSDAVALARSLSYQPGLTSTLTRAGHRAASRFHRLATPKAPHDVLGHVRHIAARPRRPCLPDHHDHTAPRAPERSAAPRAAITAERATHLPPQPRPHTPPCRDVVRSRTAPPLPAGQVPPHDRRAPADAPPLQGVARTDCRVPCAAAAAVEHGFSTAAPDVPATPLTPPPRTPTPRTITTIATTVRSLAHRALELRRRLPGGRPPE